MYNANVVNRFTACIIHFFFEEAMNSFKGINLSLIIYLLLTTILLSQQPNDSKRPWKGSAVLGNGSICAVYSDDQRVSSSFKGIQHFYVDDYTADYVASTWFDVVDLRGNALKSKRDTIGMDNFFTTFNRSELIDGSTKEVKCFAHPSNAIVLSLDIKDARVPSQKECKIILRKNIVTDRTITLKSLKVEEDFVVATWSNGMNLIFCNKEKEQEVRAKDSIVYIGCKGKDEIIITAGKSLKDLKTSIKVLRLEKSLFSTAFQHWNKWIGTAKIPRLDSRISDNSKYSEYYKRNLYSVKAANLNGMIPADITGQFLTNNMPQLYPRDAMMCARVFLLTGHLDEAKQIISFWLKKEIPKKSIGEFYARYDANGLAVDAGAGARYDEPEWDANGYLIWLINEFNKQKNEMLAGKDVIFELADFLVSKIDENELLYEGGIVEWTGYLPTTNMICSAALQTASKLALKYKDEFRAEKYEDAAEKISSALEYTFDENREMYTAVRFTGIKADDNRSFSEKKGIKLYLWDTTIPFGVLYGFGDNEEIQKTVDVFLKKNIIQGGGLQYFEAKDNAWLSGYGSDAFFFTTAALAEYLCLTGKHILAEKHIKWMMDNSNTYGLMPERIFNNESDCSPASPLSWCSGEFALSVLKWSEK